MTLPIDIQGRIEQLFTSSSERQEVEDLLLSLWTTFLNVGPEQLARSILVLSDGQISIVRELFSTEFWDDPRDVIMSAEEKAGNPGHYFNDSF